MTVQAAETNFTKQLFCVRHKPGVAPVKQLGRAPGS
jgi:hypothetical protein